MTNIEANKLPDADEIFPAYEESQGDNLQAAQDAWTAAEGMNGLGSFGAARQFLGAESALPPGEFRPIIFDSGALSNLVTNALLAVQTEGVSRALAATNAPTAEQVATPEITPTATLTLKGSSANVRTESSVGSGVLKTVGSSEVILVLETVAGDSHGSGPDATTWYHVRLPDGSEGYIHSSVVADIVDVTSTPPSPIGTEVPLTPAPTVTLDPLVGREPATPEGTSVVTETEVPPTVEVIGSQEYFLPHLATDTLFVHNVIFPDANHTPGQIIVKADIASFLEDDKYIPRIQPGREAETDRYIQQLVDILFAGVKPSGIDMTSYVKQNNQFTPGSHEISRLPSIEYTVHFDLNLPFEFVLVSDHRDLPYSYFAVIDKFAELDWTPGIAYLVDPFAKHANVIYVFVSPETEAVRRHPYNNLGVPLAVINENITSTPEQLTRAMKSTSQGTRFEPWGNVPTDFDNVAEIYESITATLTPSP